MSNGAEMIDTYFGSVLRRVLRGADDCEEWRRQELPLDCGGGKRHWRYMGSNNVVESNRVGLWLGSYW